MAKLYDENNAQFAAAIRTINQLLDPDSPSQLHSCKLKTNMENKHSSSVANCLESLGGSKAAIAFCKRIVSEQINGATDNPLVYLKEDGFECDQLISAGNFHGEYVAKASDFLGMALFNIGRFSEARIQRYLNSRTSNLPPFLIRDGGLNSGYMIAQYTTAALLSESKVLVKPSSVDSISTSASQQDHVSMGGFAARKCRVLLDNMTYILGVELLNCLSAVDLEHKAPSVKLKRIRDEVRKQIPLLQRDKYYGPDIQKSRLLILGNLNTLGCNQ